MSTPQPCCSPNLETATRENPYTSFSSSTSIRLLLLDAKSNELELSGQLIEYTLDDAKKVGYCAMSYCWGEPVFDHHLVINNRLLHITKSVFEMLSQIRHDNPHRLWIDQISINQNDPIERASQVLLMTEIYASAEQVQVWLSKSNPKIESAIRWIITIYPSLLAVHNDGDLGELDKAVRMWALLDANVAPKELETLFELEWFFRLWTVQEVAVATKPVIMRCGPSSVEFGIISTFGLFFGNGNTLKLLPDSSRAQQGLKLLQELRLLQDFLYHKKTFNTPPGNADLFSLISTTWQRRCSDERDRIYALAGLTDAKSQLPYPPSYIESVEVIYMDFAIHKLVSPSNWRLFGWCKWSDKRSPNLPSWAPDWSNLSTPLETPWGIEEKRIYWAGGKNNERFQEASVSRPRRSLTLRGIMVEKIKLLHRIQELSQEMTKHAGLPSYTHPGYILSNVFEALLSIYGPLSPRKQAREDIWRIIICDKSINYRGQLRATAEDELVVNIFLEDIFFTTQRDRFEKQQALIAENRLDSSAHVLSEPERGRPFPEYSTEMEYVRPPSNPVLSYLKGKSIVWAMKLDGIRNEPLSKLRGPRHKLKKGGAPEHKYPDHQFTAMKLASELITYITDGRSFAITESGRCAWVPDTASEGDQVAIILAHNLPLILRKVEDDQDRRPKDVAHEGFKDDERPDYYEGYDAKFAHSLQQSWAELEDKVRDKAESAWPYVNERQEVSGERYILIGEAYVHGIMDGELVKDMEKAAVQDIVLV